MAKKKSDKPITKSEFLQAAFTKNPLVEYSEILDSWTKKGHPGSISQSLFFAVRTKMGIKIVYQWQPADQEQDDSHLDHYKLNTDVPRTHYQLKVTLKDSKPKIWRRFTVPDMPLSWLHETLQIVMGWDNSHLYDFRINGETYSDSRGDLWGPSGGDFEDVIDVDLSEVIKAAKQKFVYTYDFGDSWEHEILVEKIIPPDDGEMSLVCLAGERACPPDDLGGIWGYEEFLEIISDPEHPEYEERLEWVGGEFDPDEFDLKKLNLELTKILRAITRKKR